MAYTLNRYENMLREFIFDQQDDAYNKRNFSIQRYNNLKVFMTPSKEKRPHFWVRIGISEACFSIDDGSVLVGSIGQDTKFISKWLNKSGVREEMTSTWQDANQVDFQEENKE